MPLVAHARLTPSADRFKVLQSIPNGECDSAASRAINATFTPTGTTSRARKDAYIGAILLYDGLVLA
jgi:hypothetical protein